MYFNYIVIECAMCGSYTHTHTRASRSAQNIYDEPITSPCNCSATTQLLQIVAEPIQNVHNH